MYLCSFVDCIVLDGASGGLPAWSCKDLRIKDIGTAVLIERVLSSVRTLLLFTRTTPTDLNMNPSRHVCGSFLSQTAYYTLCI